MSNPTSNFGWQMPTPTDLVTDLPADFEVFGQAVDSSMADLKGGTSGQILSKNSNSDMDFVWITNDQGDITGVTASSPLTGGGTSGDITVGIQDASTSQKGAVQLTDSTSSTSTTTAATPNAVKTAYDLAAAAIPKSTVTTNGDLIYGTGSSTVSRIGVGSAGQILTVTGGLPAWATPTPGFTNNYLLNSGFDLWQRATTSGSAGYKTADRWYENASNSTTFSRETGTIPEGSSYAFKLLAGATSQMWIQQPIESQNSVELANKTVVASAYVRASVSTGMSVNLFYSTNVDNPASGSWTQITATSGGTGTAGTSSFTRISGVYAVPASAKTVMMQISTTSTVANGVAVYIGQTQLEVGSAATTWHRNQPTFATELAACQRYYQVPSTVGHTAYTTIGVMGFVFPVTMRTTPTASFSYSGVANRMYNINTGATSDLVSPTVIVSNTGVNNLYAFTPGGWAVAAGTGFHTQWTLEAEI